MEHNSQLQDQFKACIPLLDVLTDENRQAIIMLLSQHKSGLNVNAIAEHIPLSRPAISHHLRVLKQNGFVDFEKKSVENHYVLTLQQPLQQLKSVILAVEAMCSKNKTD